MGHSIAYIGPRFWSHNLEGNMARSFTVGAAALVMNLVIGSIGEGADAQPVALTLSVDRPRASVGDTIKLCETVPSNRTIEVLSLRHSAVQIGDVKDGRVVNFEPKEYQPLYFGFEECFDGLPSLPFFPHGMEMDYETKGMKGTQYEFRPTKPGVYLLSAVWCVSVGEQEITGAPIIITVSPKAK